MRMHLSTTPGLCMRGATSAISPLGAFTAPAAPSHDPSPPKRKARTQLPPPPHASLCKPATGNALTLALACCAGDPPHAPRPHAHSRVSPPIHAHIKGCRPAAAASSSLRPARTLSCCHSLASDQTGCQAGGRGGGGMLPLLLQAPSTASSTPSSPQPPPLMPGLPGAHGPSGWCWRCCRWPGRRWQAQSQTSAGRPAPPSRAQCGTPPLAGPAPWRGVP